MGWKLQLRWCANASGTGERFNDIGVSYHYLLLRRRTQWMLSIIRMLEGITVQADVSKTFKELRLVFDELLSSTS